jgi:hypothetical protein
MAWPTLAGVMVVATVAFCVGACLLGGAGIFVLLNLGDYKALRTLRRLRPQPVGARTSGRVALEGLTEYGSAGRQTAPVSGADCAWFHVRLIREPRRGWTSSDDPDHDLLLDFSSPAGFTLAGRGGRVPVDLGVLDHADTEGAPVAVRTTLVHKRSAPVAMPAVVDRAIVEDLRKGERLTLTETRVPRGAEVFALGRLSRDRFKRSLAGLTVFTTARRDRVIAAREDGLKLGIEIVAGFGVVGLILAGGGAGCLMSL